MQPKGYIKVIYEAPPWVLVTLDLRGTYRYMST